MPLFDPVLRALLRQRLLALPYRAFLQTVVHLLSAQGYHAVAPAGRSHFKGHNRQGGWDLEARYSVDEDGPHRCVARVKQFGVQPVDLRYVDELRGAALRAGAGEALLVTLSTFSKPARLGALSGSDPVRLVDGEALLDDLLEQELGVQQVARTWEVDETYFGLLERRFAETKAAEMKAVEMKAVEMKGAEQGSGTALSGGKKAGRMEKAGRMDQPEASAPFVPPAGRGRTALARRSGPEPAPALRVTITLNTNTLHAIALRRGMLRRSEDGREDGRDGER